MTAAILPPGMGAGMEDVFTEKRAHMVDGQLRTTGIINHAILQAFFDIPREEFVPARMKEIAYVDDDLRVTPAGALPARYIMEPSPLAKLLQLAGIDHDDLVLDIGCATGYSAAIISRIAGSVIAIESDEDLAAQATETLTELGCDNVAVVQAPLEDGLESEAPYDVIVFGGAIEFVPEKILDQLKEGGRLVAVIGTGNAAQARIFVKKDGIVSEWPDFNAAIRPLPGFEREKSFHF
jgi:protein-L-isoaspartate(D-aspartate) O-methyltransferase